MADENVPQVTEQEVNEARSMGWADKHEWRGNPADWVGAKEFLEKGRQVMPLLRANNERLQQELRDRDARLAALENSVKAANAVIKTLEESHAEDVKAQVEAARAELINDIAEAQKDGDHVKSAELIGKLTELNTANREAGGNDEPGDKGGDKSGSPVIPPALKAEIDGWYTKNQVYSTDLRRRSLMTAIAHEMRQAGSPLMGAAFLDAAAEEVDKIMGPSRGGFSKAEPGGGGNGRQNTRGSDRKTYQDLPAEAKAACEKMAPRLVGPNRKHKDLASWQASYTKQYFEEQ